MGRNLKEELCKIDEKMRLVNHHPLTQSPELNVTHVRNKVNHPERTDRRAW